MRQDTDMPRESVLRLRFPGSAERAPRSPSIRHPRLFDALDIERGFRVPKSEIEIGPVHHRLPDRIRAHASVCFLALILHRLMRRKLREARSALSPERAIGLLGRIQHHQVKLGERLHEGVTTLTDEQSGLLATLGAEKPALG